MFKRHGSHPPYIKLILPETMRVIPKEEVTPRSNEELEGIARFDAFLKPNP